MTKPTVVFFGYDRTPKPTPKVFLRTLLYSSSNQGQVIEGMYAKVRLPVGEQTFSFWGYGESVKLVTGSGLYVGRTGVAANHHFVLSVHERDLGFEPGAYQVAVYARIVGKAAPILLSTVSIQLTEQHAQVLAQHEEGVLFELGPDDQGYRGHARGRHDYSNAARFSVPRPAYSF